MFPFCIRFLVIIYLHFILGVKYFCVYRNNGIMKNIHEKKSKFDVLYICIFVSFEVT